MKKILYICLIAGATASFTACSPSTNDANHQLDGSGTDADGNVRDGNVGTSGGAPISDQAAGNPDTRTNQQNTNIREGGQQGGNLDNGTIQQDQTTGTGLNPARVDADTTPNTGRTGATGAGVTSPQQGSGQVGTGSDTQPVRR